MGKEKSGGNEPQRRWQEQMNDLISKKSAINAVYNADNPNTSALDRIRGLPPAKAIDIDWIKEQARKATGAKACYYRLLIEEWEVYCVEQKSD